MPHLNTTLTKLCPTCGYRLESSIQRCPADGTRLPRERPDAAILGAYRLIERLGTGGMGVVYRAVHEKLGRSVAVKVLNRSLLSDRTNVARFFQEARSVNTIRHPHVVDVYDFVTAGKDIYTVMELLVGRDLHYALYAEGGRPFTPERAVSILVQILAGLQAAHDRSIIHRDLKPANVFLARRDDCDEFVKLLDFGLAKLERSEGRMTREGVVLGTPEYMAPEQARGAALDCRADIYGVGCLAYHMLTGSQLFAGGSYAEVMVRHVKETPPPPRSLNPALPEPLERVVLRALAKAPDQRPPSALAFAELLTAAAGRPLDSFAAALVRPRSSPASPDDDGPSALSSAAAHGDSARLPRDGRRSEPSFVHAVISETLLLDRPRRRKLAAMAVAAALVLGAGTAWVRARRRPAPRPAQVLAATPVVPRLARVRVASQPPGATVLDDSGATLGLTPQVLSFPPGSAQCLDLVLPNHRRVHEEFQATDGLSVEAELAPERLPAPPETRRRARSARRMIKPSEAGYLDSKAQTINPFER